EWPRGSGKTIDFASGLWLVGKFGRTLRAAVAEYSSEFRPGPILPNGLPADPEDPQYRIYKIRSDGTGDWASWPFDDGAPAAKTVDGRDSLDAQGRRIPQLLGDQTLWWVMNDLGIKKDKRIFGSHPMGVEVQVTVFGYAHPAPYDDMMFIKWKIINKSANRYDSCYVTLWDDPDLGDAHNDLLGCDTTLAMGYCYDSGRDSQYHPVPPSLGFVLLQGPVVPAPGESARAFGRVLPNYKNLGMTAFIGSS
ncbi:MAG: hypothetical protein D6814_17795, partial [Calditrichaeota bacterium]